MPAMQHSAKPRSAFLSPALGVATALAGLLLVAHSATAQSATGTVTGRVLWGSCIRAIPLPLSPGAGQPGTSGAPDLQPMPGGPDAPTAPGAQPMPLAPDAQGAPARPLPITGLPAGAVLVAVQNTPVNARTDEAGRFTLSGVPAGQYMTVAAGPVADSPSATAERPNVLVSGGQSVDIGTLSLGGGASPYAIACRVPYGSGGAAPIDPTPSDAPAPASP